MVWNKCTYYGRNVQQFNGYCYACNKYGSKAIECMYNVKRNGSGLQQGWTCHNYNKLGHIARFCRGKNE